LQHCSATLVVVLIGWFWAAEPLNVCVAVTTAIVLGAIILIQRGDRHAELQAEAVQSD